MMSKSIGFNLNFPAGMPPTSLLREFLQSGLNDFFRPKMGRIATYDESLEFGPRPYKQLYETTALVEGEQIVTPGITTLSQWPDATGEIIDFLTCLSTPARSHAELVGDYWLSYAEGVDTRSRWLFRYGDDFFRLPVVCYIIGDYGPPSWAHGGSSISLFIHCPLFFLKDWLLEDGSCYSTPDTAEHNWSRLIDLVHLLIDVAGEDKLEELYLNLEGWGIHQEDEWLIERARQLPKLKVHLA